MNLRHRFFRQEWVEARKVAASLDEVGPVAQPTGGLGVVDDRNDALRTQPPNEVDQLGTIKLKGFLVSPELASGAIVHRFPSETARG